MGSFKFGILETFLVLLLPRPLRIHNVVLCLYVLSPKVQGDASMVVETTMRSVEIAMDDACERDCSAHWDDFVGVLVLFQQGVFELSHSKSRSQSYGRKFRVGSWNRIGELIGFLFSRLTTASARRRTSGASKCVHIFVLATNSGCPPSFLGE